MSRTRHLIRRGNRWHYNRAFPLDVQMTLGKAPFRMSLGTGDLSEALRARAEAERRYWAAVDGARAQGSPAGGLFPSAEQAQSLAVEWFRSRVAADEPGLAEIDAGDLSGIHSQTSGTLADLRRELAEEGGGADAIRLAGASAKAAGYAQPGAALTRLIQRARIAHAEVFAARAGGDYGAAPSDPLFAAALAQPPAASPQDAPKRTIADLERAFKADRWEHIRPASRVSFEGAFRVLRGVLGESRAVEGLSRDDGRAIFDAVRGLPRGYPKGRRWEGVSLLEAVETGKRAGLPVIAPATVNKVYMGLIGTIMGWAVNEGWLTANPVRGLRVPDPVPDRDKRDPFTPEQLGRLFSAPPWTPPNREPRGRAIRYWLPLIALFQGLRLGVIAQLRPASFIEVEGVKVFTVEGSLKNANAHRTLPIHPTLLRLGLWDLAQSRRGEPLLFGGETAGKNAKWGDAAGDWFGRHIAKLGFEGRRLGVHSFRHNFEGGLRRAGLHGTAIGAALAGRKGGDPVAGAYGKGFDPGTLAEALAGVNFPGFPL